MQKPTWTGPAVVAALLVFAALQGAPVLMLALAAVPPAMAVLAYTSGWTGVLITFITTGALVAWRLPEMLLIALPWCALSGVIACVPLKRKMIRPLLWGLLCMGTWAGTIALLSVRLGWPLIPGLAQAFVDWVNTSPQRNTILLNTYSMGLSRLDAQSGLNSLAFVLMPDQIRLQLLYSLRVSVEELLPSGLCEGLVYHTALTVILCTALPDWRRRRSGEAGVFPPMEQWYIPRGLGLAVSLLGLGWLVAYMSSGGVGLYMGLLCAAVFKAAYLLQGVCLLMWLEKRIGIRSVMRNIWAVVLSLLAPVIPIIMGIVDQRRDARHLRPDEEVETL